MNKLLIGEKSCNTLIIIIEKVCRFDHSIVLGGKVIEHSAYFMKLC